MDALRSILNFNYQFKPNQYQKKPCYNNLQPLKSDTISFGANISKEESSVNLDWIEDKAIKKMITRIFNNSHVVLTKDEIVSLLKYFNYELKRRTGDEQYKHKYLDLQSIYTMKANENKVAISYTNRFKLALKYINQTGGELLFSDNPPSDEDIAKFNSAIKDCPEEHKNPYRLRLEEHQKQILQNKTTQTPTTNHSAEITKKGCIKFLESKKEELIEEYYNQGKETIEKYLAQYQDDKRLSEEFKKAKEKLQLLLDTINSLKYEENDNNESCCKKAETVEESVLSLWYETISIIEDKIKEIDTLSRIEEKEKIELFTKAKTMFAQIKNMLKSMKEKSATCQYERYKTPLKEIEKEITVNSKRISSKIINELKKEGLQNYTLEELQEKYQKIETHLKEAQEKEQEYNKIYNEYLKQLSASTKPKQAQKTKPLISSTETKTTEIKPIHTVEIKTPDNTPSSKNRMYSVFENNIAAKTLPSYARNLANILIRSIELETTERPDNMNFEEFSQIINRHLQLISKSPDIKRNNRALNLAFLDTLTKVSDVNEEIYTISNSEIEQLRKQIRNGENTLHTKTKDNKPLGINLLQEFDINMTDNIFQKYATILTYEEVKKLAEKLKKEYTPEIPQEKLEDCIKEQGKYLTLIFNDTSSKELKSKLLKLVYSDFDKSNNTNYSNKIEEILDKKEVNNRIKSLIEEIDWENL